VPITRDAVLDAVTPLLARDASASTGSIARAAGISRATLGRLFPDRDAVVRALLQRCVERVVSALDRGAERARAGEPLVPALVAEVLPEAQAFAFLATQPAAHGDEADRIYDGIVQRLDAMVLDAQRAGRLRTDLPARWVSDVLHVLAVAGAESLRLGRIPARDVVALVTEAALHGVGPRAPG
jgi:TetR/AcrR family transcriptional regulator, mexCD-oprJ operon repressor